MTWQANLFSLIAFLAGGVAVISALLIWRRRNVPGRAYLVLLMLAAADWTFCVALESATVGIPAKLLWSKIEYLGFPASTTFLLLFALSYARRTRWLTPRRVASLFIVPTVITFAAWTNDWHGLMWSSLTMAPGDSNVLIYSHGPGFYLSVVYYTLTLLASSIVLIRSVSHHPRLYRLQVAGVVVSVLPAWLVGAIYTLAPSIVGYVDVTPLGLLVTALVFDWSLLRYRMSDLVPVARDALVDGMSDGVLVLDARNRIVDTNRAALRLLGLPDESPVGKPAEVALALHQDLVAGLRDIPGGRGEILLERSAPYSLEAQVSYFHDGSGQPTGRLVVLRDVTERRLMEAQLHRAQRLETAGQIAAQVGHDFNNLLVPMIAYPDLIKLELPEDHPAVKYCNAMLESAEQMAQINEEIMVLGRTGHFEFEPTDLNQVVRRALAQIASPPGTEETCLDLAPDLLLAKGSEAQLLRVVVNLVINARDAMTGGGRLCLKTENYYLDRPLTRYNRVEVGEYVKLTVTDNGSGIPDDIKGKVFDAFFTSKRWMKKRGSGLGLAIVQTVVSDHHGYVDLQSEVGKGTSFYIYLPLWRQAPELRPEIGSRGGAELVLVVDDDQPQRDATTQMLRTLGYRVQSVASGEAAVEQLRVHPADLLILDMVMPPGMDGLTTYQRVLAGSPGQRAILVSGYAEKGRVQEAQALGAGPFLRKPVSLDKLGRSVREELDRPRY